MPYPGTGKKSFVFVSTEFTACIAAFWDTSLAIHRHLRNMKRSDKVMQVNTLAETKSGDWLRLLVFAVKKIALASRG